MTSQQLPVQIKVIGASENVRYVCNDHSRHIHVSRGENFVCVT